jgi:hypothetical protein
MESYFDLSAAARANPVHEPPGQSKTALDQLLGVKSRILRTKLEVLSFEMGERLRLWNRNLGRIDADKERLTGVMERISRLAEYHFRDHREKSELYEELFNLETERRSQDVECWRDVVMVMKDFLAVWEAHEQAKARAIFLDHAG